MIKISPETLKDTSNAPSLALFRQPPRLLAYVERIDSNTSADGDDEALHAEFLSSLEQANLVTSMAPGGRHFPVLDIDVPMHLVPSSTPGHSHLYIGVEMDWPAFVQLLEALTAAGIVEPGYTHVSKLRGYTSVRLPWVYKPEPVQVPGEVLDLLEPAY